MDCSPPQKSSTVDLLRKALLKLVDIVDDEEHLHLAMGERLINLSASVDPSAMGDLVEKLQYFDRLQQRTRYVVKLIEHLISEADCPDEVYQRLVSHSTKAPFVDDGRWLEQLLERGSDASQRAVS